MHCTAFVLQGFVYEVGGRYKVLAEVKTFWVLSRDAEVQASVSIKALVSNAALLGVCCIQDVSDAQVTQRLSVLRDSPVGKNTTRTRRNKCVITVKQQRANNSHTVYSLSLDLANNSARQPTMMARHSHISYVEVRPDFIHWSQLQIAGIQDVLQLFNERQLLLLFARRHSPCTAAPIQRSAPAVCAHRQVTATVRGLASTERHEQVAVSNAAQLQN